MGRTVRNFGGARHFFGAWREVGQRAKELSKTSFFILFFFATHHHICTSIRNSATVDALLHLIKLPFRLFVQHHLLTVANASSMK